MPIATLLIVIQLAFWIFASTADTGITNPLIVNTTNSSFGTSTTLTNETSTGLYVWDVILDPTNLGGGQFIQLLVGLITGATVISVGLYLIFKTDLIITFPVFTALLGFGSIPLVNLYNLVYSEVGLFGCAAADAGCFPPKVLLIFVGILGIWWLMATVEWWTGKSVS